MIHKFKYIGILMFVALLAWTGSVYAANPAGGSIKYTYIGPGATPGTHQYYIEAYVYQDCQRLSPRNLTQNITATCSSTGSSTNFTLNYVAYVAPTPFAYGGPYTAITLYSRMDGEEVSDLCDTIMNPLTFPNSSCRTGLGSSGIPGYIKFVYAGNITLSTCNYWTIGLAAGCCRAASINANGGTIYLETQLNNLNFPKNSSPHFSDEIKPFPSACANQIVNYGVGTVDLEGDSLVYALTCSMTRASTCVTYKSGYSATSPVAGFKMDSLTGLIQFTPKITGKIVATFWVKEYERCTGKWKGQTLRDVMFIVTNCVNKNPQDISGISNLIGPRVKKLGKYSLQTCNGETFSFEDTIYDVDKNDTLLFKSNHNVAMPGSRMSINYLAKNKAVVTFTWTTVLGNNPLRSFFLEFNDDNCNYPGHGLSLFEIEIVNSTSAGKDVIVCKGVDTARLVASGGRLYKWRSIYGDSLIWTGTNKNVWVDTTATDTNKRLKFVPTKTTYLEVWSDLNEGCRKAQACTNKDTVKVIAAENYALSKSNDTIICFHDSTIQIQVQPDSNFAFNYKWSPSSRLNHDSIRNPMVTPIRNTWYQVTVTSDSGCIKHDSIYVGVTTPMPDSIIASTTNSIICPGDPTQINLTLGIPPGSCGKTAKKCVGSLFYETSNSTANFNGSGSTGVANWPCAYGGASRSARQQFLYTATELNAMGVRAGIIEGLGFNVVSLNAVGALQGYTIKLKCVPTSVTNLSSWQISGLVTVFNPKTVNPIPGWNLHYFDQNYNYDGVSNLIVEVCWDKGTLPAGANASVAYVATTNNSCVVYTNSAAGACTSQFLTLASRVNRPTLRVSFCGARDSTEFTYKWKPALGLNSDTVKSPIATIFSKKTYSVVLTDTFNKCKDSTTISLDIATLDLTPDTAICAGDTIRVEAKIQSKCSTPGKFSWSPGKYFSDSTISNPKVSLTTTTTLRVTYTDACGCIITDSLTILADSLKPGISITNPNCSSNLGQITISPKGGVGPYLYSIDSGKVYQQDSIFKNILSGYFFISVKDSFGCKSEIIPDTLFNSGAPVIDSLKSGNISCYDANDGQIRIYASGISTQSLFSIDSGATWQKSTLFNSLPTGRYVVYAKGGTGCLSLPKITDLTQPDSISMDLKLYTDSCYEQGHGWAVGYAKGGTGKLNFNWSGVKSGASHLPVISGDSLYSKLFAYNGYKLEIQDSIGCSIDCVFTINQVSPIVFDSTAFKPVTCYGYDDGQIFVWVHGGNKPKNNISYKYSADSGKTFTGPTYSATPNYAIFQKKINGFPLSAKTHKIVVKDSRGCIGDTTITVTEPPKVELSTLQDSFKICVSTCTKLEVFAVGGNSTNHKYHWTPTVSNTGVANVCPKKDEVYTVYASDEKGCASNSLLLKVDLYDSLNVNVVGDSTICYGDFTQLKALPSGGKGKSYNFTWQPFRGLSNAFINNPVASPNQRTTYVIKLYDECGSTPVYDSISIRILDLPKADFEADTTDGCPPFTSTFKQLSPNTVNCIWEFGDGTFANTCQDVRKEFITSGVFDAKLVVYSLDGCKDSIIKPKYITSYQIPEADFSVSPQPTSILNTNIEFTDNSQGRIKGWEWNFAGIDTSLERNPVFRFPDDKSGSYLVRLDVKTENECSNSVIKKVIIDPSFYLYIPSSFSPNGDGINDTWKPVLTGFEQDFYSLLVFDRWGEIVFESRVPGESWDGKSSSNGSLVQNGVFTYVIVVGDALDEKSRHEETGSITVIR